MASKASIGIGRFFFRYRNALFPAIFVIVGLTMQPKLLFQNPALDRLIVILGIVIALLGEVVRLVTIGYEYIERGGKNRQVYASHLVQGGVYAHVRNPMYLGNGLIAIGVTLETGSPTTYAVVIPFFLFVYWSIVAAEEEYLRAHFAAEYVDYCHRVPRFLPSFTGLRRSFAGTFYDWKRALRKELSTMAGLASGLIAVPLVRRWFLEGPGAARAAAPVTLSWIAVVAILYGIAVFMKRRRWFFYTTADHAG